MFRNSSGVLKNKFGYTLIEILLVVSLIMITCLALSSATLQGVRLFIRIGMNGQDRQAGLMMDHLTRDLRSMTRYSGIMFRHDEDRMTFARTLLPKAPGQMNFAEISYVFNKKTGEVVRREILPATSERAEIVKEKKMIRYLSDYELRIEGDQYRNPRIVVLNISYGGYFGIRQIEKRWMIPSSWVP